MAGIIAEIKGAILNATQKAWVIAGVNGGDLGSAAYADTSAFDASGAATTAQAAAITSLGGADGTVTDEQLRNWAGRALAMMTSVTRTDYSKSWTGTDGRTKYAGWIQITGTVTWPDGVTGHLDGVEYPDALGILQYFTASHVASGKIVVQSPLTDGAAGLTVITPDYYVDSSAAAGGDGSLASPFDTLSDLSLSTSDIVALKSGSTFYETITPPASSSYYRYGAGAKPILDQRDTITAWTKTGGYTNIYQATITIGGGFSQVWEDGAVLAYKSSLATLDGAAGGFYVSGKTAGSITIYVHTTGSDDPTSNGSTYKATVRLSGISGLSVANVLVDGLHFISNTEDNGAVVVGKSAIIRHCVFEEGTKHNALAADGTKVLGCIFENGQYDIAGQSLFVFNENIPTSQGVTIDACAFLMDTYTASMSGVLGHQNTSGSFGAIVMSNCYASKLVLTSITESDTLTFRNVAIVDGSFGAAYLATTNIINCYAFSSTLAVSFSSPSASNVVVNVYGGYILSDVSINGLFAWSSTGTTLRLVDLIIDTKNTGVTRALYPQTSTTTIIVIGCQFVETGGGQWTYSLFADTRTPTLAMNGNIYAGVQSWRYNSTQYSTIADWRAATGQDGASIAY